jgi:hypothetical protein
MKDNKIIAEFMGLEVLYRPNSNGFIEISDTELCDVDDLMYHKSWDWLMPVIQKIMDISFFNGDPEDFYSIRNSIPQIRNTYKAVVEFIKQYNNED